MNHIVNFGLLFSFLTLAVSGCLAFMRPFSLVTSRVHIVFGLVTMILVGCHLATRLGYFRRSLSSRSTQGISARRLTAIGGAWLLLLVIALSGWFPSEYLIRLSYEYRHRTAIVRSSPLSGFESIGDRSRAVVREVGEQGDLAVSLIIQLSQSQTAAPSLAVWAETPSGSMIETLYLDPSLAYTEVPNWGGIPTPRHQILPIWRHRYTLVSGIDYKGEVDAVSGATRSHRFALEDYLVLGEEESFVLCVEVNQPGDPNEAYPDPHLGQPSLLYTAYIEPGQKPGYVLLELTGHGGDAENNGAIHYDLESCTSALKSVDFLLANTGFRDSGKSAL